MVADRVAKWDNFTDHDGISVELSISKSSYTCHINQVCLSVTELDAQNWVLLMLLQDLQKLTEKTPASC